MEIQLAMQRKLAIGVSRRTMKFLLGVLHGKWILRISWVAECLKTGCIADEEQHEVTMDSGGRSSGPILGRMHAGLKLLKGWEVNRAPSPALSNLKATAQ